MTWDYAAWSVLQIIPFVFVGKTLAFTLLAGILHGQENDTEVGFYLTLMFYSMVGTSLTLTAVFLGLAFVIEQEGLAPWLWLEVPLVIFPTLTGVFGFLVSRAERSLRDVHD